MPQSDFMAAVRAGLPIDESLPECRLLNDALLGSAFVADPEQFWYVSYSFAGLLKAAPAEISGTPLQAHFDAETCAWLDELLQQPTFEPMTEPRLVLLTVDGNAPRRELMLRLRPAPYLGERLFVGAALDVTENRRNARAMEDYARRLRLLSQQVLDVQENERRNLARELHDEIGQQLTMIKLTLAGLAAGHDMPQRTLDDALAAVSSLMGQVRDLSLDLRPSMLDDLGLAPAVRWYAERVARLAELAVKLEIDEPFPRLRPEVETLFFRVAQEAITNVMRHAGASHLRLRLAIDAEAVTLVIEDDGVGFDPDTARTRAMAGGSAGLLGMQERAALSGASLVLETGTGSGTELILTIALDRASPAPSRDD